MRAYYLRYCKILSRVIKEAKRQHYNRLITKFNNQIKTTWNIIRHERGKSHLTEQIPSLLINDEKVKDPKDIADAFNTFFLTITQINLHQEAGDDAISFLREAFPEKFPGIKTIPSMETEIKSIIHSLKTRNPSGYDGITSKIIKLVHR
jgi:hypothetical protein